VPSSSKALRRYFLRAAEPEPRVIVYEDIHWMDGASEEWLAAMIDSVPAIRILHVFTHRTGYVHPFGERSYFTRIAVGALSDAESLSVARAVLATSDVPTTLREAIARRADGNPFFVEEIVKLHQEGAIVSETVQGIITARIDRLADGPKRVLLTASVDRARIQPSLAGSRRRAWNADRAIGTRADASRADPPEEYRS
jgi:adenylate cyclase